MNKLYQGYKIQIYPNDTQKNQLLRLFNSKIIAYNWGMDVQRNRLKNKEKLYNRKELTSMFMDKIHKEEDIQLQGISRNLYWYAFDDLNNTIHDWLTHSRAFASKHAGSPRYKSLNDRVKTFSQRNDQKLIVSSSQISIAKIGKVYANKESILRVGEIYKPSQLASIRFTYTGDKYFVSFNKRISHPDIIESGVSIGIDLGIKVWATSSVGLNLYYPTSIFNGLNSKLRRVNKKLSRSDTNTNNYQKILMERRKIMGKITNVSYDHIRNYVSKIVSMKPCRVVMEDLNVRAMSMSNYWNHKLKYSQFRYFRDQMEYQCTRNGIEFVLADHYYPSSKLCSHCGNKLDTLSLQDRVYECPKCSFSCDRDLNAAINLANYNI